MRIINCYYTQNIKTDSIQLHLVVQDGSKKYVKDLDSDFKPYFYSKRDIQSDRIIKKEVINALNGTFNKYTVKLPMDVSQLREQDKDGNVKDYEADILFGRRYIYDNNVDLGEDPITKCYIDIETQMEKDHFPNPQQDEITFISVCSGKHKTVIYNNQYTKQMKYQIRGSYPDDVVILQAANEGKLLEMFFNEVKDYSMLVGWNSKQFDKPFIEERSKLYNLNRNMVNFVWADLLDLYRRFISSYTTGKTPPSSLTLDNVSKYVLGYGKSDKAVEAITSDDLIRICRYNLNDSELVEAIDTKAKLTDLVDSFSLVLKLMAFDCDYFGKMIESCIMREMKGRYIFQCHQKASKEWYATHQAKVSGITAFFGRGGIARTGKSKSGDTILGGYVHTAPSGVLKNIAVFDFAGLYPNIIRALNASPETIVPDETNDPELIVAPLVNHKYKKEPTGIFSKFITDLMVLRKHYKKLKAETHDDKYEPLQQMTKYLINAFFGITAHPTSRIYDKRIGESVTATGRYLIQELEKHFDVIYADTDSVFIPMENPTEQEIKQLQIKMNIIVKDVLSKFNMNPEFMEIRFEKLFRKVFFMGVKKRYYGNVTIDEDFSLCNKVVSRGLEIRRTDWCRMAVDYESKLLDLVLDDVKEANKYHNEFIETIRTQPIENFVIYKTLSKPINEYKHPPPHVRASSEIDWVGTKIGFIVTGYKRKKITHVVRYEEGKDIKPSIPYYKERQIMKLYQRILEPLTGIQTKLI